MPDVGPGGSMDIAKRENLLPDTIDDLHTFIIIGNEQIKAQQAKIRAIDKTEMGYAAKQAALADGQTMADLLLDAEARLGVLLEAIPKKGKKKEYGSSGGTIPSLPPKISKKESHIAQTIAGNPDIVKKVKATAKKKGELATRKDVIKAIKKKKKAKAKTEKDEMLQSVIITEPEVEPKRLPKTGEWWQLGKHLLYCGDTSTGEFIGNLSKCAFAFADPPYNADAAEWDNDFNWEHDYLTEYAKIAVVTPGISSIFDFAKITTMPYLWSMACFISNGMTRGAIGFGNWIYSAIFSHGSIHRNSQDIMTISIKTSESDETTHKGRKPTDFLTLLFDTFTKGGDTIIDPFLGSGQTLLVCEKIGRVCIGGEISSNFCAEIINRWETSTGEIANVHSI